MKDHVNIFAPATIANVGSGFDVLGFALSDIGETISLSRRTDRKLVISSITGAELPTDPKKNICGVVLKAMLDHLGEDLGLDIAIHKEVLPGSGLGSSASSAAGSAFALNAMLGYPLDHLELTQMAMKGEEFISGIQHADNVAPCIYGGCTLIRSYDPLDIIPVAIPKLTVAIVHPQIVIRTAEAKKILGDTLELSTARRQWANLAGLMLGMSRGDLDLLGRSMEDVVAEPKRAPLIPHFQKVREIAFKNDVVGFSIAGSGPAMFAFCREVSEARRFTVSASELYRKNGIDVLSYVTSVSSSGTSEIL